MNNMGKPYIPKQINPEDIPDKQLIKCECGNEYFIPRIQFYKFYDQEQKQWAYINTQQVVCNKCGKQLPEHP